MSILNNYENYTENIKQRTIKTEKDFNSLTREVRSAYQKLFQYEIQQKLKNDRRNLILFIEETKPLNIDGCEVCFKVDFEQSSNQANIFSIKKYSYVLKNGAKYYRFDYSAECSSFCHPLCHLHLQDSGKPRVPTHIVTPFDFLAFVADELDCCDRLEL